MVIPPKLRQGDTIGILAPSRKIKPSETDSAVKTFQSWGLNTVLSENIFSGAHSYLSGGDAERLADLQTLLNDVNIKAIVCARGGYGSTRILDSLDLLSFKKSPKWVVGFSDITAVHLKLLKQRIASIHGTMPILFSKPDSAASIESLRSILMDDLCSIECPASVSNRPGKTQAPVIGGNLSLILDSLGTSSEADTDGKILVIEEIDEYLYKMDRMMTQLLRAGKLSGLKGLIVGHMTDIKDSELSFGETVEQIILNAVKKFSYPVAFNFPSGHENPNLAWIQGGTASFEVNTRMTTLRFENAVST